MDQTKKDHNPTLFITEETKTAFTNACIWSDLEDKSCLLSGQKPQPEVTGDKDSPSSNQRSLGTRIHREGLIPITPTLMEGNEWGKYMFDKHDNSFWRHYRDEALV
ncbi:hypothetical protein CEXT_585521 [Caerostris extrusa]|uniref:Uncharacterized protein n=1 Tax=Caerostris extrusa TaxID=172846 RepID=A0AAV4Y5N5_CAEEX|nr:hypothetical protein CEXT_585521 [Caerostris extrusa]